MFQQVKKIKSKLQGPIRIWILSFEVSIMLLN
jgi:hypothetical protein